MKLGKPLKQLNTLFDLINELEVMYGIEIEVSVIEPKYKRFGKGVVESTINLQKYVNKHLKD